MRMPRRKFSRFFRPEFPRAVRAVYLILNDDGRVEEVAAWPPTSTIHSADVGHCG
jgi:hypothetical protein